MDQEHQLAHMATAHWAIVVSEVRIAIKGQKDLAFSENKVLDNDDK